VCLFFFKTTLYTNSQKHAIFYTQADVLGYPGEHPIERCKTVEFPSCGRRWKPWMPVEALSPGERICREVPLNQFWVVFDEWRALFEAAKAQLRTKNVELNV
jgi:hypothetical protein